MSAPSDRPVLRQAPAAFSRPLTVDDVSDDGLDVPVEANAAECAAVAEDIGLPGISALAASFHLSWQSGRLRLEGAFEARITQICVVSLEPFDSDVTQPVDITFARLESPVPERHARRRNTRDDLRRSVDMRATRPPEPTGDVDVDAPDPIIDGRIDLGVVAVEFLTLALDFYPKKPGVGFSDVVIGETEDPKPSAFAALERFKDRS